MQLKSLHGKPFWESLSNPPLNMKTTVFLAALVAVTSSFAQLYPSSLGLSGEVAVRLSEPRIQHEFNIDESQAEGIRSILGRHAKRQSAISDQLAKAKPEDYGRIQKELEALESATVNEIVGTLTLLQKARLREVALQHAGPFAMRNPQIAKSIGLTPSQSQKIESLAKAAITQMDEINAKMGAQLEGIPDGKAGDARRLKVVKDFEVRLKAVESKAEKGVLALLSKPQTAAWSKAKGKPFAL